jgi:hypothetical protein
VNSNVVSNFMKIDQVGKKLQRLFEILNLAGISAYGGKFGGFLGDNDP